MPELLYSHARRLYESLCKYTDEKTAGEIVGKVQLSKSPTEKKKREFVEGVCSALTEQFDTDTVKKIRMACCCQPPNGEIERVRRLYECSADLTDFAARYNAVHTNQSVWVENGVLFYCYPRCYCSTIKYSDKPVPIEWCYCTLGYTKTLFERAFGCPVEVELLETVKTGGSRCVMSVKRCR